MTDFTDYSEDQIAGWMCQGSDLTAPTALHVGLHTADPGQAPDGTTEVSTASYSRVETTAGTDWNVTGNAPRTLDNATDVEFAQAGESWGTVTHVSLWDAATDGNCLAEYALDTEKAIDVDDTASFASGSLSFAID